MNGRQAWLAVALVALATGACGGDDDGGGNCPDVSGDWVITVHSCQPTQVGTTITIHQSGCTLTQFEPWPTWNGSIDASGAMTWSGDAGGTTMTCEATLSGTTIAASCTPSCEVTVQRP